MDTNKVSNLFRKTGQLITRSSKHVKTTPVTSEQYLWDQLNKNVRKDTVKHILKQSEKQTMNK